MNNLISRFVMGGILLGTVSGVVLSWILLFGMAIADSISLEHSVVLASLCMVPIALIPGILVGGITGLVCALLTGRLPSIVEQPLTYQLTMIVAGAIVGVVASMVWLIITGDNVLFWLVMIFLIGPVTAGLIARGYVQLMDKEKQLRNGTVG